MRYTLPQSLGINAPDYGNPFARNLVSLIAPASKVDSVRKKAITISGNASYATTPQGIVWSGTTTNCPVDIGASGGLDTILDVTKPWSWAGRINVTLLGTRQIYVGDFNVGGGGSSISFEQTASNQWYALAVNTAPAQVIVSSGAVTLGWHDVLISSTGGSGFRLYLYVDGALIGYADSASAYQQATGQNLRLMNPGLYPSGVAFAGQMLYSAFFNADVTANGSVTNVRQFVNPGFLFKNNNRNVVLLKSSSGGSTDTPINPGTGSVVITGSAPSLTVSGSNISASPGVGSIAISGQSPSLSYMAYTTPVDGAIFPLAGGTTGNASVPFTGTYSGTAPNQWQVVLDGTSTAVAVTGGTGWQSFASPPAGGTFSQTVSGLPKLNGWYNIQVRNSGTPGTVYTSGKVGAGCLIAVDGQSNAWYWFSTNSNGGDSTLTPNALVRVTGKHATIPNVAWDIPATATMNGAIACGNALAVALGCPIGLVDGSWDASGLVIAGGSGADGPNGEWVTSGARGISYNSSATSVTAAGGKILGTVWIQGEGDAGSGVSQSAYYTGLGQMIGFRRTDLGDANSPYVIATLARNLAGMADANRESIKQAQVQKCADANIYRVDRMDLPLQVDGVHHTAPGFTSLGQRCAQAILYAVGNVAHYRGPQISSAVVTSSKVIDVSLTQDMGTDFTPSSGITGFRIVDNGNSATVSTAVHQTSTLIRLTMNAALSTTPTVEYLYGSAPDITGVAKDNGTLTLPLEYNGGLSSNISIASNTGNISLSGSAPTLSQTANQWESPGSGTVALSGLAPSLGQTANQSILPGVGSIVITGLSPTTLQTVNQWASPGTGTLTFSGYAPTITQAANQGINPGTGSIAITGSTPATAQTLNQFVSPSNGSIVLSGLAPTVGQTQSMSPGMGTIALSGLAPSVSQAAGQSVNPGTGTIALSGLAPGVSQSNNVVVNPTQGAIVLSGLAPSISQTGSISVSAGTGSITLSGKAPSITVGGLLVENPDFYVAAPAKSYYVAASVKSYYVRAHK